MSIRKFRASRVNSVTSSEFVGQHGDVFYDEDTGQFRVSDGTTPGGHIVQTTLNLLNGTADIFVNNIVVNGTSTTINNIVSNNESTLTGVLTVTGNAAFTGNTVFSGNTDFVGLVRQLGDRIIVGNSTVTGSSTFVGDTVFLGTRTSTGNIVNTGNVTYTGNITTNGNLIVVGPSYFFGNITEVGNLVITGKAINNGPSVFNGAMVVTGDTTMVGNVVQSGNLTINGVTVNNGLSVFNGNIAMTGNAVISGNTAITGNTLVTGNTRVIGATYLTGNSYVTGNTFVTGTTTVAGNTYVTGQVTTITGNTYLTGNSFVTGTTTVTGDITVTGNSTQSGLAKFIIMSTDPTRGAVEITGNSSGTVQSPIVSGVMLHVTGQGNNISRIYNDAQNGYALFAGRRYNGDVNTPSPVNANDDIMRFAGGVYTSAGWANIGPSRISFVASENQTGTNQGGRIEFWTTANSVGPAYANIQRITTIDSVGVTVAGNLTATNVIANTVGTLTGNVNGTIMTAYQPNITSVGVLSNLTVAGSGGGSGLTVQGNLRYDINYGNGTVTQLTDKTTAVTCNGRTGQITTAASSLAKGSAVTFTVNNSYVTAVTDLPVVAFQGGATINSYAVSVTRVQVGSFNITISNNGTGPLTDTIIINFAVMKIS